MMYWNDKYDQENLWELLLNAPHTVILKTLHPAASFSSWQLALASLLATDWLLSTAMKFQPEAGKRFIWNRMGIFEALHNCLGFGFFFSPSVLEYMLLGDTSMLHVCWVLFTGRKITVQRCLHINLPAHRRIVTVLAFLGYPQKIHKFTRILKCIATSSPTDFFNYSCAWS